MRPTRATSLLTVLAWGGVLGAAPVLGASVAGASTGPTGIGAAQHALLFSSDGMRPDLMEKVLS